jgi:hypothetical protein
MVCQAIVLVRQGDKYGPEYVKNIEKQLTRYNSDPWLFHVLGDGPDSTLPLTTNAVGWWSKMELFSPRLKIFRPFTYIDLDSIILDDISALHSETDFCMCKEWMPGAKPNKRQSSVMLIPKEVDHIWEAYQKINTNSFAGDQDFLEQFPHRIIQADFPGYVGSYKVHNIAQPVHRIITFHGRPKPKDAEGWPRALWHYWMKANSLEL